MTPILLTLLFFFQVETQPTATPTPSRVRIPVTRPTTPNGPRPTKPIGEAMEKYLKALNEIGIADAQPNPVPAEITLLEVRRVNGLQSKGITLTDDKEATRTPGSPPKPVGPGTTMPAPEILELYRKALEEYRNEVELLRRSGRLNESNYKLLFNEYREGIKVYRENAPLNLKNRISTERINAPSNKVLKQIN